MPQSMKMEQPTVNKWNSLQLKMPQEEYVMLQPWATNTGSWDDTAMDDKRRNYEKSATDQQMINGSTDQQINGSTDFWINGSKDQRIKSDNQNR